MDVALVISQRLAELGLDQKDLAQAAQVTESYISQLLTRRKPPPSPGRTAIYERMDTCLQLPKGELARLAVVQQKERLRRQLGAPPAPLFPQARALLLRTCAAERLAAVREILDERPYGVLERIVLQKLFEIARQVGSEPLSAAHWSSLTERPDAPETRDPRGAFRDVSANGAFPPAMDRYVWVLEPLLRSWDVDLATLAIEVTLHDWVPGARGRHFRFVETDAEADGDELPGLRDFLRDRSLSESATTEEIELLRRMRFGRRRPTALFYHRALQALRDPLHFRGA